MTIYPEYKLFVSYDVLPDQYDGYYRYILSEYIPTLRDMGLHMMFAWQITWGDYPARQLEFICENREIIRQALTSARWNQLETRLRTYTTHYQHKLVYYHDRFQF